MRAQSIFVMPPLIKYCTLLLAALLQLFSTCMAWGFFGHERINRLAVYCLPPPMMALYKTNVEYIVQQSTAPDKRRYMIPEEGPRHYLDADRYGIDNIPHNWFRAVEMYSADTLQRYGILPWHLERMMRQLTKAFMDRDNARILRLSAEIGHYMADAHVPLHASSNHNGQLTGQHGIHGLWESRIPELVADRQFDYWTGAAVYINDFPAFIWQVVRESSVAADTVLRLEKQLSRQFPADRRYAYELRNGVLVRNYSADYTKAYHSMLGDMVERRMRGAIAAVAACWYTAWEDAGQPPLNALLPKDFMLQERERQSQLDSLWKQGKIFGRVH